MGKGGGLADRQIFLQAEERYVQPERLPKVGGYRTVPGVLMLLFAGFQRVGYFAYVRADGMVCGALRVGVLPAVSAQPLYLADSGGARKEVWQRGLERKLGQELHLKPAVPILGAAGCWRWLVFQRARRFIEAEDQG